MTVTEISNITAATLQARNNQHMAYHEEWIAPKQVWHVVSHKTYRHHAQKKITQNDIKMANRQVTAVFSS